MKQSRPFAPQAIAAIKKSQDMLEAKVQMKKEAEAKRIEQVGGINMFFNHF